MGFVAYGHVSCLHFDFSAKPSHDIANTGCDEFLFFVS